MPPFPGGNEPGRDSEYDRAGRDELEVRREERGRQAVEHEDVVPVGIATQVLEREPRSFGMRRAGASSWS